MYKILITETNKYFAQFGQNNTGNVLWAITLFYGQLYRIGMYILIISREACFFVSKCVVIANVFKCYCLNTHRVDCTVNTIIYLPVLRTSYGLTNDTFLSVRLFGIAFVLREI